MSSTLQMNNFIARYYFSVHVMMLTEVVTVNWTDNLNNAIAHIEARLTEKIDYNAAAASAFCSLNKFQRLFLFVTGIALVIADLIRNLLTKNRRYT